MIKFKMLIITPRNDGCFVEVEQLFSCKLKVTMISQTGNHVTADEIEPSELAAWIDDHRDW